jgi:hypothetical protein
LRQRSLLAFKRLPVSADPCVADYHRGPPFRS